MQGVTFASVSSDLVIFASVKAFCHCFLPKVDELIRKPVLLARTALRGSLDGRYHTGLAKDIHLHPFLSVEIFRKFCHAVHPRH